MAVSSAVRSDLGKLLFWGWLSVAWSSPSRSVLAVLYQESWTGKTQWAQTQALHIQLHPVASGLVLIVGFGLNVPTMGFCILCWWFFDLDTCGYSHWLRKGDKRIASSCRLFLYFLGTGPWEAWKDKWWCFVSQPVAQGYQQHLLQWDAWGFRHCSSSEAFSEAASEPKRTKKSETERFLCLTVLPGAIQKVPVWNNSKGKVVWLVFVVCLYFYLFLN